MQLHPGEVRVPHAPVSDRGLPLLQARRRQRHQDQQEGLQEGRGQSKLLRGLGETSTSKSLSCTD